MVISTVNQVVYNGDGVTTAFPFTFRIIEATDIKLLLIDADGAETDISADYYVDTVNNTVYYPGYAPGAEPPAEDQPPKVQTGQKLVVYRELPITQEKDLGEKWPFYVIELGLDKLTMILQQIFDWWGRTLKISQGGSVDGFDTNIYPEAGKVIAVNEDGDGFEAKTAMLEENNAWGGNGLQIKSVAEPTDAQDAATKGYADGNFMKLQDGGAAWESRNLPIRNVGGPVSVTDAATKDYVDRVLNGLLPVGDARLIPIDTAEQMVAAHLEVGQIVVTLGYHDVNDGGAGVFAIRSSTAADMPVADYVDEYHDLYDAYITAATEEDKQAAKEAMDAFVASHVPTLLTLSNGLVADLLVDGIVNVKQCGAKGDGVTDDSRALIATVEVAKRNNAILFFPEGMYIHGDGTTTGYSYTPDASDHPTGDVDMGRDIRLIFDHVDNAHVIGYGATIKSHDGNGECRNNAIFVITNCNGVTIEGITVDANSQNRQLECNDYNDGSGRYQRNNFYIISNTDVVLRDVSSLNSMMQGYHVIGNTNVLFDNCHSDYAYSNGIFLSRNLGTVRVINGSYDRTGAYKGINPKAGIDVEADYQLGDVEVSPVLVEGTRFVGNRNYGLLFSSGTHDSVASKCYFEGSGYSGSIWEQYGKARNNRVEYCTFVNAVCYVVDIEGTYKNNIFIKNNDILTYSNRFWFINTTNHLTTDYSDIIEGNVFYCDLSALANDFVGAVGVIKLDSHSIFRNNIIRNIYGTSGYNYVFDGYDAKEVTHNTITYDYTGTVSNPPANDSLMIRLTDATQSSRLCKDNTVDGYYPISARPYKEQMLGYFVTAVTNDEIIKQIAKRAINNYGLSTGKSLQMYGGMTNIGSPGYCATVFRNDDDKATVDVIKNDATRVAGIYTISTDSATVIS